MKIKDIPEFQDKNHVLSLEKDVTIRNCVKKMHDFSYGSVVITEKKKVIGIFTERDLLNKVVANDIDPDKLTVDNVMSKNISTAKLEDNINHVLRRMSQGRFSHMPIVNDQNELIGVISQGDLVSNSWSEIFHFLGVKTKSSFLTNTQIWMLFFVLVLYGFIAINMIE